MASLGGAGGAETGLIVAVAEQVDILAAAPIRLAAGDVSLEKRGDRPYDKRAEYAEQYERIGIVQQLHYVASHGRAFWIGNAFPFFFQGLIKTF